MTVAELIEALQRLPPDLPVIIGYEAQDGGGEADSVQISDDVHLRPIVRIS